MANKQYGLILSNKKGSGTITRPSIFDEDSDSDTPTVSKPTGFNKTKKQDLINHQKALEEDPTVFQYDELYDDMEQKKRESKLARKDIDRKPKYISKLLEAADRRKKENERRIERQVQKEREAEGEEFKDKESFVTSAYKKKLEEMRLLEEQEKREEYLETIGDVTKQGNLDGFYRHLYEQKVNFDDKLKQDDNIQVKEEILDQGVKRSADEGSEEEKPNVAKKSGAKRRKYRSRQDSQSGDNSEKEEEVVEVKKEHLPSNLDADSDFSVDSSDSESDTEKKDKKLSEKTEIDESIEHEGEKLQLPAKGNVLSDNAALLKKQEEGEKPLQTTAEQKEDKENKIVNGEEKPKKPKDDIWKKRTVGTVFDEAVVRYFERKAARGW